MISRRSTRFLRTGNLEDVMWTDRDALSAMVKKTADILHKEHLQLQIDVVPNAPGHAGETAFGKWIFQEWRGAYDLKALGEASMQARRAEVGNVREIITDELDRFRAERSAREVAPLIAALHAMGEDVRAAELQRHASKLGDLSPEQRAAVEQITHGIVNKLLHEPTVRLKEATTSARGELYADALGDINRMTAAEFGDPETNARVAQYEMAFRMQSSVPELTDISKEPAHTFDLYGEDARKPGTFAANCLLARRLAERGVRFIQLYHRDWDHHGNLPADLPKRCKDVDRASAGLIQDLQQRGMLDDTLVVWGGEFGRTVYCQGRLTATDYGRDHHGRCFTMWAAGGGMKPGITVGETDDYGYNITKDPVHVHDLQATILHCLGIDHLRLTYKFQGREFRLTDVDGNVVKSILKG